MIFTDPQLILIAVLTGTITFELAVWTIRTRLPKRVS